jgi:hypothetical protein
LVKHGPPTVPAAFELLLLHPAIAAVNVTPKAAPTTHRQSFRMVLDG